MLHSRIANAPKGNLGRQFFQGHSSVLQINFLRQLADAKILLPNIIFNLFNQVKRLKAKAKKLFSKHDQNKVYYEYTFK